MTGLAIACGTDAVQITRLQRAGGKALDADVALRGFDPGPFVM
jgi:methionyl-tRNA formyltransferase